MDPARRHLLHPRPRRPPGDPAGIPVNRRDDGLGPMAARRRRERPGQEHTCRERAQIGTAITSLFADVLRLKARTGGGS
jgi:hypothetical protein